MSEISQQSKNPLDEKTSEQLMLTLYNELYRLAEAKMKHELPDHTLQATALVNEAYIRLVDHREENQWNSRGHFYCAAAEAMRRILVDHARRKRAVKRGSKARESLLDEYIADSVGNIDLVELDDAIESLAIQDPRKAELVKLRYFAGLTIRQAADTLGIATSTADADWAFARAWLRVRLGN